MALLLRRRRPVQLRSRVFMLVAMLLVARLQLSVQWVQERKLPRVSMSIY